VRSGMEVTMNPAMKFNLAGSGAYLPQRRVPSYEVDGLCKRPERLDRRAFGDPRTPVGRSRGNNFTDGRARGAASARSGRLACEKPRCRDWSVRRDGGSPFRPRPYWVQRKFGLGNSGIPAFDINATCPSFLVAFERALLGMAYGQREQPGLLQRHCIGRARFQRGRGRWSHSATARPPSCSRPGKPTCCSAIASKPTAREANFAA